MNNGAYIVNLILYIVMGFLVIRMVFMSRKNKKNQQIIRAVQNVKDKEFFENIVETFIASEQGKNPELVEKMKVIRLWGVCYHKDWNKFDEALESLDLKNLYSVKDGIVDTRTNDDSFFYLYLAIPNILQAHKKEKERRNLVKKLDMIEGSMKERMDYALSEACYTYYTNEGDRGFTFFNDVMNGEYGQYEYSKTMIRLYKDIAGTMLVTLYKDKGNEEKYEEMLSVAQGFYQTRVGVRWIKNIGIKDLVETKPEEVTEENESKEVDGADGESGEVFAEDSEENTEETK